MKNAVYQGRNAVVSPVPDVSAIILPKEEKNAEIQIILASDGLWDVFSNRNPQMKFKKRGRVKKL